MYLRFWMFAHRLRRLLGNKKGKIIIRERKGNYDTLLTLTFICPCIANTFAGYNKQDATSQNFFISVRRSTCFRRFFHPSSGAQNCTYSVRYLCDQFCYLPLAWLAAGSSIGLHRWRQVLVWQIPDAVCAVSISWWWTEKPSETCRASYRNK